MKVFVSVDALKAVGDIDRIKLFATADAAKTWLEEHVPKGEAIEYEVRTTRPNRTASLGAVDAGLGYSISSCSRTFHSAAARMMRDGVHASIAPNVIASNVVTKRS